MEQGNPKIESAEKAPHPSSISAIRDFLTLKKAPNINPLNKPLFTYVAQRLGSYSLNELQPNNLRDNLIQAWHMAEIEIPVPAILQELADVDFPSKEHFDESDIQSFVFAIQAANKNSGTIEGHIKDTFHRLTNPKVLLLSQKDRAVIQSTVTTTIEYIRTILNESESTHSLISMHAQLNALLLQTLTQSNGMANLTAIEQHTLTHLLFSLQFIQHTEHSTPLSEQITDLFTYQEDTTKQGALYAIAKSVQAQIGAIPPLLIDGLRDWGTPQRDAWQKWFTHMQNQSGQSIKTRDF